LFDDKSSTNVADGRRWVVGRSGIIGVLVNRWCAKCARHAIKLLDSYAERTEQPMAATNGSSADGAAGRRFRFICEHRRHLRMILFLIVAAKSRYS
jgi:hypothetical protein